MGMFYKFEYKFIKDVDGLYTFTKVKELVRYSWEPVQKFINAMYGLYDCIQLDEGSLGIGDWILVKADDNCRGANFYVVREHYANCWSSYQTIEPKQFLSAQEKKELEEAEYDLVED